jgi:hypothetical protein
MKKLSLVVVLSWLALASRAALPQPDLIAQIHFAGAQKILAAPNVSAFTNEFCSTEALALRTQTANKLAGWLAGWLQTQMRVNVPDGGGRLRPLLDDLQQAEFFLESRLDNAGKPEVALAIRLDAARASVWQAALKPFLATATFKANAGWLIFDSNPAGLGLGARLAQRLATPATAWFDLDINWPNLARWFPDLAALGLPETQIAITAPDANFRLAGKFYFPNQLALKLDPWVVPTNLVHTPFNSFTAARGFAAWLQGQAWAQPYQLTPAPNQLFLWSQPMFPFEDYAAIPVPDANHAVEQLAQRVWPVFTAANAADYFMTSITPQATNHEINFTGTPFVAPHVRAIKEPNGQFLFGELFPNTPHSKGLPPELFQRLATPNLVFYHWEITAERIPQLLHVTQLGLMLTNHKQLSDKSAAYKWLQRAGGTLGNTDTEIIQSGPAEFTFARKTPGILTASELFTLANWLEATNFPGGNIKLPPRIHRPGQPQPFHLTTPTPAPGH